MTTHNNSRRLNPLAASNSWEFAAVTLFLGCHTTSCNSQKNQASEVPTTTHSALATTGASAVEVTSASASNPIDSHTNANGVRLFPAPSTVPELMGLSEPPEQPFVVDRDFPQCLHPGVRSDCENGFCRIPAGCYIWGSPESEPLRGNADEDRVAVTLTHDFELQQFETTVAQWEKAGFATRDSADTLHCRQADCPITWVNWHQAALYANYVSTAQEPPLPECYVMNNCGVVDGEYRCESITTTTPSIYKCSGYRLPTRAEWQYAARAGTTTPFYSGGLTSDLTVAGCPEERNLNPIAWYCFNSNDQTHPVGGKWPNAWGLHDMLGNASEFLHEKDASQSPSAPAVDPYGDVGTIYDGRPLVGGNMVGLPSYLRAALGVEVPSYVSGLNSFRLARTLPE